MKPSNILYKNQTIPIPIIPSNIMFSISTPLIISHSRQCKFVKFADNPTLMRLFRFYPKVIQHQVYPMKMPAASVMIKLVILIIFLLIFSLSFCFLSISFFFTHSVIVIFYPFPLLAFSLELFHP